jgi:hypothetical protein
MADSITINIKGVLLILDVFEDSFGRIDLSCNLGIVHRDIPILTHNKLIIDEGLTIQDYVVRIEGYLLLFDVYACGIEFISKVSNM